MTSDCLLVRQHRKMSSDCDGVGHGRKKNGGRYCVAGSPSQQSCRNNSYTSGITMHQFPKDKKLRQEWARFVRRHRPNYKAQSRYAALSIHFDESSFTRLIIARKNVRWRRNLIPGAVPTRDSINLYSPPNLSQRDKRQVTT